MDFGVAFWGLLRSMNLGIIASVICLLQGGEYINNSEY